MGFPTVIYTGRVYSFRWYSMGYATINLIDGAEDGSTPDVAYLQGDEAYDLYAQVQRANDRTLDLLLGQYDY